MFSPDEAKEIVLGIFEEEALVIGGLVAIHHVDDDLVWRLMKNFDVILSKSLKRLDLHHSDQSLDKDPNRLNTHPHPAIEEFLMKLRSA